MIRRLGEMALLVGLLGWCTAVETRGAWQDPPASPMDIREQPAETSHRPPTDTAATAESELESYSNMLIAGSGDAVEVRHVVLQGSNFAIGKKLAEMARDNHGVRPVAALDPLVARAQRVWFERNFPIHWERMRGAANGLGVEFGDDRWNVSSLPYGITLLGCSVAYYPPGSTADGVGVLSRNYDFTTGTFAGLIPKDGAHGCTGRPYVLELHPDQGYSSISLCAYDLLGGVLDGMNSEGLTVALLADDELMSTGKADPARNDQAGLEVLQVGRMLLETCANVEEAKVALRGAKLYYSVIPCHYIVADRHGDSFIWENAVSMHYGHVIDGGGKPQLTTNFMLHLHPEAREAGRTAEGVPVCRRYARMSERVAEEKAKFTLDFIKETNAAVAVTQPAPAAPRAAHRTLWHALYFPEQRRMEVDFYLGEEPGATSDAPPNIRRSGYREFYLGG